MSQDTPAGSDGAAPGTGRPVTEDREEPPSAEPVLPERGDEGAAPGPEADAAADDGGETAPPAAVQTVEIRRGGGLAVFALLIALAGLGGSAFLWWQLRSAGPDEAVAASMARVSGLGERVDALTGRVEQLETRAADLPAALPAVPDEAMQSAIEANRGATARLEDRLASLDERLDTLSQSLATAPAGPVEPPVVVDLPPAPAGLAWRGAEIELLLRVAQRRVALAGDPAGARTALSEADRLNAEVDESELLPVRRQIAGDLTALDSLPAIDIDGIAFRLGSMQARIASLPVLEGAARGEAPAQTGEDVPEQGLERLERKSLEFISGLVRVRDSSADDRVFHTPAELWFLRRNLELELQSARVALLTANSAAFRDSLSKAARWTENYFDPQDPGVTTFLESLRELEARPIAVEYPELGALGIYLDVTASAADQ